MKRSRLFVAFISVLLACVGVSAQNVIFLPTASEGPNVEFEENDAFINVSIPTMTMLPAKGVEGPAPAMIVCPGGGYFRVGKDGEGFNVAGYLAEQGITCFVLKYRTRYLGDTKEEAQANQRSLMREIMADEFTPDGQKAADAAYEDAIAAIQLLRSRAQEFGIDPDRIGIVGFSAGANLAMRVGLHHTPDTAPNIVAPIYLWMQKDYTVPEDAAPLFLCAPQNDLCPTDMSYNMYKAWSEKNLPAEIHVLSGAFHGHGYQGGRLPSDIWIELFCSFLKKNKFID